jgi:hypothetical protein
VLLARVGVPGTEYSNRVGRFESMCRVAVADLERLLRHAARAEGASEDDLEERVRVIAGVVVRLAAQRAAEAHRSAKRPGRRAEPGPARGT